MSSLPPFVPWIFYNGQSACLPSPPEGSLSLSGILAKAVWNKGQPAPHVQEDMQKCEWPWRNVPTGGWSESEVPAVWSSRVPATPTVEAFKGKQFSPCYTAYSSFQHLLVWWSNAPCLESPLPTFPSGSDSNFNAPVEHSLTSPAQWLLLLQHYRVIMIYVSHIGT